MARRWWRLAIVLLLFGCGKLAPKGHTQPTNTSGTGGTVAAAAGSDGEGQAGEDSNEPVAGKGGSGANAGSGGMSAGKGGTSAGSTSAGSGTVAGMDGAGRSGNDGGRGGGPQSPYEPTNMNVPVEGDGTLLGGSVEGGYGDGWDACGSKHPGLDTSPAQLAPYDGMRYLAFDSTLTCAGCAERTSDLQVIFWFDTPVPEGAIRYLYFDVVDYGPKRPTGTLLFGSPTTPTQDPCSTGEVLASIALEDLAITSAWQTRCVELAPRAPFSTFGLYVADGTFQIGIDALRFGPPCRAGEP